MTTTKHRIAVWVITFVLVLGAIIVWQTLRGDGAGAKTPPKAHAAACQLVGGRLVPVGARERNLTNCVDGARMTGVVANCLGAFGIGLFGSTIGHIIAPKSAREIVSAAMSAAAVGCLKDLG